MLLQFLFPRLPFSNLENFTDTCIEYGYLEVFLWSISRFSGRPIRFAVICSENGLNSLLVRSMNLRNDHKIGKQRQYSFMESSFVHDILIGSALT